VAVVAARGSRRLGEMLLRFSVFGYIEIRNFFIIYGEEVGRDRRGLICWGEWKCITGRGFCYNSK